MSSKAPSTTANGFVVLPIPKPLERPEEKNVTVVSSINEWTLTLEDWTIDNPELVTEKKMSCFRHFEGDSRVQYIYGMLSKSLEICVANGCTNVNIQMKSLKLVELAQMLKFVKIPNGIGFKVSLTELNEIVPSYEYLVEREGSELATFTVLKGGEPDENLIFNGKKWNDFPHIKVHNCDWIASEHVRMFKKCKTVHLLECNMSNVTIRKLINYFVCSNNPPLRELVIETGNIDFAEITKKFNLTCLDSDESLARDKIIEAKECCIEKDDGCFIGLFEKKSYKEILNYGTMGSVDQQLYKCPRYLYNKKVFFENREERSTVIIRF